MNILCEVATKDIKSYIDKGINGFILSLEGLSVGSSVYFSYDEIKNITIDYNTEVFVSMNKNFFNSDLIDLEDMLNKLNDINIKGVIFYDIAILKLKRDNNYSFDLVWGQEHMTTNYNTCNYYHDKGVKYVYLSKEITLDEVLEINEKSEITPFVYIFGLSNVAYTRRKLISNFEDNFNLEKTSKLEINEKVSHENYKLLEEKSGTVFYLDKVLNCLSSIKTLYNNSFPYLVFGEFGIEHELFLDVISDTVNYINSGLVSNDLDKYKDIIGEETNFLFKKSIYKVK